MPWSLTCMRASCAHFDLFIMSLFRFVIIKYAFQYLKSTFWIMGTAEHRRLQHFVCSQDTRLGSIKLFVPNCLFFFFFFSFLFAGRTCVGHQFNQMATAKERIRINFWDGNWPGGTEQSLNGTESIKRTNESLIDNDLIRMRGHERETMEDWRRKEKKCLKRIVPQRTYFIVYVCCVCVKRANGTKWQSARKWNTKNWNWYCGRYKNQNQAKDSIAFSIGSRTPHSLYFFCLLFAAFFCFASWILI